MTVIVVAGKNIKGNIHITVHSEDDIVPMGGLGGDPPSD